MHEVNLRNRGTIFTKLREQADRTIIEDKGTLRGIINTFILKQPIGNTVSNQYRRTHLDELGH